MDLFGSIQNRGNKIYLNRKRLLATDATSIRCCTRCFPTLTPTSWSMPPAHTSEGIGARLRCGMKAVVLFLLLAGCADEDEAKIDAGSDLTATGPDLAVNGTYPAPHDPLPLMRYGGGPLLTHPHIVTITFAGDSRRAQLEQFGDIITTTPWWIAVASEYCQGDGRCIGPGSASTS